MEEEEVSPGSLETDSPVRDSTEGVRLNMEEEGVKNGEPLFTPNAKVDFTLLVAASADPIGLTVVLLAWVASWIFPVLKRLSSESPTQ